MEEHVPTAPFHIQASPEVSALPKLVLKHVASNRALWRLPLAPGASARIDVTVTAWAGDAAAPPLEAADSVAARRLSADRLPAQATQVATDHDGFNALVARSLADLQMVLPPWLRAVELRDLRAGGASVDLAVSRGRDGASVELIARRGDVELIVRR